MITRFDHAVIGVQNIEIAIELDKGELVSDLAEKFQVTPNFVKSIEKKAVYEEHRIKKTKKIRFSEAEREILVKRMENGESLEDILSESGVEENTFRRWCKKFGVNIPRSFEQISKSEKLEIRQLLQVYGWQEISEAYNITKKSIEEMGLAGEEEERRLAYVGITRAKKLAYISFSMNRFYQGDWIDSMASRFIEELPEKNIEKNTFYDEKENLDNDFEFNQDFEFEESTRSPGWIRYQKRIK